MSILVIAEHDNNDLKGSTLNTVAAAKNLDGDIHILVAGSGCDSVISECQKIDGFCAPIETSFFSVNFCLTESKLLHF